MHFILASKSPRRKEILENLGLDFEIITADCDETCNHKDPTEYVKELALRKGNAVRERLLQNGKLSDDTLIIASDTVVVSDGEILGKPKNPEDAERMLHMFSGKTHCVISGIALLCGEKSAARAEITHVRFDHIPEKEIRQYIVTGEPYDKAGAYAIQGFASLWITGIKGDYFNVVGFPVKCFADLLKTQFDISLADCIQKGIPS